MTNPVILLGTQSNGETLPVQVDATGRLVAEGLQGPEGEPGPEGPPGADGGTFPLPPDPQEDDVLGWQDNQLAWVSGLVPPPPEGEVLVVTTFDNGLNYVDGTGGNGYRNLGVITPPENFQGFLCASFTITDQSPFSGIFIREFNGDYREQNAKDQTLCDSIGTMNRDPDWTTLSCWNGWAEPNGVVASNKAIPVSITKDLQMGMYMWVFDCSKKQLFIGETFGQSRWVNAKQPGMAQGIATTTTSNIQICASPYTARMKLEDTLPPPILGQAYVPRAKHYRYERDRGQVLKSAIRRQITRG